MFYLYDPKSDITWRQSWPMIRPDDSARTLAGGATSLPTLENKDSLPA